MALEATFPPTSFPPTIPPQPTSGDSGSHQRGAGQPPLHTKGHPHPSPLEVDRGRGGNRAKSSLKVNDLSDF